MYFRDVTGNERDPRYGADLEIVLAACPAPDKGGCVAIKSVCFEE